jgi:hypothetical protein
MCHESNPDALALAASSILFQILKGMDGAKRFALIDRAAETIETGPNSGSALSLEAAKMLRGEWIEASSPRGTA